MRSSGSKRSWRLAVVVLLVLGALAIAAPAAFAFGSIEGTLTAVSNGDPLENINAYAFHPADVNDGTPPDLSMAVGVGMTDSLGHYEIAGLPGGPLATPHLYKVWFQDMIPFNHYVAQWYMGSSPYDAGQLASADVPVVDNVATLNIDDALYATCTLSGDVNVSGIEVYVYTPEDDGPYADFVEWVQTGNATPDDVTDGAGEFMVRELNPTGGAAGPAAYYVYVYDPSGKYAPQWYNGVAPWAGPGDALTQPIGDVDMVANFEALVAASAIAGSVDGAVDWVNEQDLADIDVYVYAAYGQGSWLLMGTDTTDGWGRFEVGGLPVGSYFVKFVDPSGLYYGEWFDNHGIDTGDPYVDNADQVLIDDPGYQDNGVYALLQPIPSIHWLHPPFGVNDGPDRYNTVVEIVDSWGMHFVSDVWLVWNGPTYFEINPFSFWSDDQWSGGFAMNLASPLARVGTYDLYYSWNDVNGNYIVGVADDAFQVVNSYVPTTPITPPAPAVTPTVPVVPAPVTPPVVTPEPAPAPAPVAGPVTVAASKASVKKGALATLKFQVDEPVLGGNADVKITIMNKAGKVVKQVKATVKMNAAASISFRCKLAKGSYSYTVSAGSASATSKLIVK